MDFIPVPPQKIDLTQRHRGTEKSRFSVPLCLCVSLDQLNCCLTLSASARFIPGTSASSSTSARRSE